MELRQANNDQVQKNKKLEIINHDLERVNSDISSQVYSIKEGYSL